VDRGPHLVRKRHSLLTVAAMIRCFEAMMSVFVAWLQRMEANN